MFNFGKQLKSLRQSKGITQKQLAIETNTSERGIQNYETGVRKPTYDILVALSEYFKIPSDYLLGIGIYKHWDETGVKDMVKNSVMDRLKFFNLYKEDYILILENELDLVSMANIFISSIHVDKDKIIILYNLDITDSMN